MKSILKFSYKNPEELKKYTSRIGKILPRKKTGLSSKMQKQLTREVKRARQLALLPFLNRE